MKNIMNLKIAAASLFGTLVFAGALPAAAISLNGGVNTNVNLSTGGGTGIGASANVEVTAEVKTKVLEKAHLELSRRTERLNELAARVNAMEKLSPDTKATLIASINTQIAELGDLGTKIDTDSDRESLRADVQSITKSYRIFALVIPQGAITAAADRILTIGTSYNDFSANLQARISAEQNAGHDVSALLAAMADMKAKVADANVQANAAISLISGLKPDNGDQATLQSNTAALKDARGKVQVAHQDYVSARADAETIMKGLRSLSVSGSASSSASTTVEH